MREIKFRAWDKKENKFIEWHDLVSAVMFFNYIDNPRYTLQQFTGLKDKNGKEIYEGDVVKNQHGAVGEYVWSERCSGWDIQFRKFPGFETMNEWEVIGNIHQNPELLT